MASAGTVLASEFSSGFSSGRGEAGPAATQRRTRSAHGARGATGAKGGGGASCRANASTCRASASSIHRNGIDFRIGILPGAIFDSRADIAAHPCDECL
jgi:hypothetical protein